MKGKEDSAQQATVFFWMEIAFLKMQVFMCWNCKIRIKLMLFTNNVVAELERDMVWLTLFSGSCEQRERFCPYLHVDNEKAP